MATPESANGKIISGTVLRRVIDDFNETYFLKRYKITKPISKMQIESTSTRGAGFQNFAGKVGVNLDAPFDDSS